MILVRTEHPCLRVRRHNCLPTVPNLILLWYRQHILKMLLCIKIQPYPVSGNRPLHAVCHVPLPWQVSSPDLLRRIQATPLPHWLQAHAQDLLFLRRVDLLLLTLLQVSLCHIVQALVSSMALESPRYIPMVRWNMDFLLFQVNLKVTKKPWVSEAS
jgi:hypothetical protein